MENAFDDLAPMHSAILDKMLSEDLNKVLCQLKWNSAGTRINWSEQGPHKSIKFGSGIELGELDQAELSEFNVLKHDKIVLLFSADENALLIQKEALLSNWGLLDCFIAAKFFLIPYQDVLNMQLSSCIECDPLSFIAGHI